MSTKMQIAARIVVLTAVFALGDVFGITITNGLIGCVLWAAAFEAIFWAIGSGFAWFTKGMDREGRIAISIWLFPLVVFALTYLCSLCPTFHVSGVLARIVFAILAWVISLLIVTTAKKEPGVH